MIKKCVEWLKPGGYFLCNLAADKEGDVLRQGWFEEGVNMWSFNLGVEGNREMFGNVKGLEVLEEEVVPEKVGKAEVDFYWIFGRKVGGDGKETESRLGKLKDAVIERLV